MTNHRDFMLLMDNHVLYIKSNDGFMLNNIFSTRHPVILEPTSIATICTKKNEYSTPFKILLRIVLNQHKKYPWFSGP